MTRLSLKRSGGPVYREILSSAFQFAWQEKRFWPLSFFASLLLTAGTYDVILRAMNDISNQSSIIAEKSLNLSTLGKTLGTAISDPANFLGIASGLQIVLVVALLLITFAAISCTTQAALVYAIGATKRGHAITSTDAFRIGGGAFWPVAALNALIIATLWILRFLAALPLVIALENTTQGYWLLYFFSFLLFVFLSFVINIIQIFALNALVLQGAPVSDALIRGYNMFKKNWVVTIETALLLFIIATGIGMLSLGIFLVSILPLFAALVSAALLQSSVLYYSVLGLGLIVALGTIFITTSFVTQLQYSTWTLLYRKLGEGGVIPKIHRWVRALTGNYHIPQN